jgi:hypothetical protein
MVLSLSFIVKVSISGVSTYPAVSVRDAAGIRLLFFRQDFHDFTGVLAGRALFS